MKKKNNYIFSCKSIYFLILGRFNKSQKIVDSSGFKLIKILSFIIEHLRKNNILIFNTNKSSKL